MLLDFQMPKLNGVQVVGAIRKYLRETNCRLKDQHIQLLEPKIVFVTAFLSINFKNHLQSLDINHAFEKPL